LQSPKNKVLFHKLNPFYSGVTDVVYNWVSVKKNKNKDSFKLDCILDCCEDKTIFFYGGNMGFAQDMPNLLKLVKNMTHRKNAHFLFIGDGDQRDLVEKAALELPNLTFHPSVNQQKFEQILTKVDIGLFSLSADHTTHNFPGKLLGYMVNGIPILGSINEGNDLKKILESYGAGKAFVNGNDTDFKEAAEFLLHNSSCRKNMGIQGIKLSKDLFSVHNAADKIVNSYFKWKQNN